MYLQKFTLRILYRARLAFEPASGEVKMHLCVLEEFMPSSKRFFDRFWSDINFAHSTPLSTDMWVPTKCFTLQL